MTVEIRGPFRTHSGGNGVHISGVTSNQGSYPGGRGSNDSLVSPGPPYTQENGWTRWEVLERRYPSVSGKTPLWTYSNWYSIPPNTEAGPTFGGGVSYSQTWSTKALALMNPVVPEIQFGTFLWELRDFPRMLQQAGHALTKPRGSDIPGSYVAYQFGWSPLVSDLWTLIHLGEAIQRKHNKFAKAQTTMRMSGTLERREWTDSSTVSTTLDGKAHVIKRERRWTMRAWYVAKWKHRDQVPEFSTGDMFAAYRRALGSHQPISAIWNALPWSWFVDYFLNVGDFLEASEGGAVQVPTLCIMYSQDSDLEKDSFVSNPHGLSLNQGTWSARMRHRRILTNPTPQLRFEPLPWLSDLDTLGALLTAKAMRRTEL